MLEEEEVRTMPAYRPSNRRESPRRPQPDKPGNQPGKGALLTGNGGQRTRPAFLMRQTDCLEGGACSSRGEKGDKIKGEGDPRKNSVRKGKE